MAGVARATGSPPLLEAGNMLHQKFRSTLTIAVVAVAAAGCTTLRVKSDAGSEHAAAVCHTYAWAGQFRSVRSDQPAITNPLIESRLRAAIASNLESRGVRPASGDTAADCVVGYGIGVRTTVEGGYPGPYAWGWGWGPGWGPGWGFGYAGPYVFREGLIAVNLYEAKKREPLWHASVTQSVQDLTGADAEAKINAAVSAIFGKYPG